MIKEACVQTLDEALIAQQNGADRIELCSRLDLDGLTPSRDLIRSVKSKLTIPIKVMIRPRAGNFVYNNQEIEQMKNDILFNLHIKERNVLFWRLISPDSKFDFKDGFGQRQTQYVKIFTGMSLVAWSKVQIYL